MKLTEYLAQTGLRPFNIATAAGLPPSTLTRFLSGERSLSMKTMQAIRRATGGKVSTLEDFEIIMAKKSKAAVNYTNRASMASQRCDACKHFLRPGSCTLVEGAINPAGWCKLFER